MVEKRKPCTVGGIKESVQKKAEKRFQCEIVINNIYQMLVQAECTVAGADWILEKVRQAVHENATILDGEVKLREIADGVKVFPRTKS